MPRSNLTEGMREGDLADLVLPLISVDEYRSKVDEKEALVFGFYVHDQAAADDLNRFLQKSAAPILDTEVSPAPDQHGYFMVFVELSRDSRLAQNVDDILSEIESLVDIDEWQMRVRDLDDLLPFSQKNLITALKASAKKVTEQAILDYLGHSALDVASAEDDLLILQGSGERHVFEIVGFGGIDDMMQQHKLTEAAIAYDFHTVARTDRILRMLGEGWLVLRLSDLTLLHHSEQPDVLLLR